MHYHVKQESIDVKYFFDKSKVKLRKYIPLTNKLVQNTNKINETNLDMLVFTNKKIMQEFKKNLKKLRHTLCHEETKSIFLLEIL